MTKWIMGIIVEESMVVVGFMAREIQFPISVRQAQKLAGRGIGIESLRQALGLSADADHGQVKKRLDQLAGINPCELIHAAQGGKEEVPSKAGEITQEVEPSPRPNSELGNDGSQSGEGGSGVPQVPGAEGPAAPSPETGNTSGGGQEAPSESSEYAEGTRKSASRVANSPSTALGEERTGEKRSILLGGQPRAAGAQETGDSQPRSTEPPARLAHERVGEGARPEGNPNPSAGAEYGGSAIGCSEVDPELGEQPGGDAPTHQKKWGKWTKKASAEGQPNSQPTAHQSFGGVAARLNELGVNAKLVKLCRQKLAVLVGDTHQEYSPRRDYTEFCVRLKTYRNPAPARREEQGRPVILVMADVSWSCSRVAKQSLLVAKAASRLGVPGADVLVLAHSNGQPVELERNGVPVRLPEETWDEWSRDYEEKLAKFYEKLVSQFEIQAVIALGDCDAVRVYFKLLLNAAVEKFVWLDPSRGEGRLEWALKRLKPAEQKVRHKLTYKEGCSSALEFINNIK